ncbi:MAG: hypothetical protein KGD59_12255 [Candidatus Heimdallarchaeota archaeon]|nr:hypothetical protein [Candidatus Heimdallarchaeota archaeon]MBY8995316.1 hypothetical protein [Candidatus Heimdallarchaeota archaeon]
MSEIIEFRHSDLADALYYFEYHGPLKKKIDWVERDKDARELYKIIREIKFSRFKHFLPWARNIVVLHEIDTPKKLARFIENNPPRGKFGEKWLEEIDKLIDIVSEILSYYKKNILTKEKGKELEDIREEIKKKYSKYWSKLQEESMKLPGISWKRKEPIVCLLYPLDGKLSHKLTYSDIAYIETSRLMVERDDMFLHEVVKLLNYSKPIGSWVRQDRRGIRAVAYELFTELQTLKLINALTGKKPNFQSIINEKMYNIWIPYIRPDTSFDEDELERILGQAYKKITRHEFDGLYQLGELYTELNIILLT